MANKEAGKIKYHFLTGEKPPVTKDFDSDDEAIAEAKKDKTVIRVQSTKTMGYVYERDAEKQTPADKKPAAAEEKKSDADKK